MEDNIEELKRQIEQSAQSGKISDSDLDTFKIRAQRLGVSPTELDGMLSSHTSGGMANGGFQPRWYHLVIAVLLVILMSLLIFMRIDFNSDGGHVVKDPPSSLRNMPITAHDLVHIFSGNCGGQSVLITVKGVEDVSDAGCVLIYDLKCDFVPVVSGARCEVDLTNSTFDFGHDEAVSRKVELGKGHMERTMAGKVVLKPESGKYELIQL